MTDPTGLHVTREIATQPECWRRAAELASDVADALPWQGERVAVVGCGTSAFMAMAYAALRESSGQGETDAFTASEAPTGRTYDRVVAISRSGTTTEVLDLLERWQRPAMKRVALTAVADVPIHNVADETVLLDFADEESVVQTRFATSALALLRAHLGADLAAGVSRASDDAATALTTPIDELAAAEQISFVGTGWTIGLAHEAALKTRESAQFWAESYSAMEYRHGPISIAQPGRLVWGFGALPVGLADDVRRTGAGLVTSDLDPMAHLVVAQRVAVELGVRRGLDVDRPRSLTRAVELTEPH